MPKLFNLQKFKLVTSLQNTSLRHWIFYFLASVALVSVFSAYYTPDMMVAVVNQIWGLCGW